MLGVRRRKAGTEWESKMKGKIKEKGLNHALLLAHLIPVLLFLFSLTGSAIAEKGGIPEDAAMCLSCHGSEGLFMVFKDNEKMSVTVRYGRSQQIGSQVPEMHRLSSGNFDAEPSGQKVRQQNGLCTGSFPRMHDLPY